MNKKENASGLLKVLGVGFGIAVLVGNAIGIGILRMPGTIASYLSNEWLITMLWILGGFLSLVGAVLYAEASTAFPFAGGPFAISEKVFGKQAGFTVGFCDWVLNTAANAGLAIASAEYIHGMMGLQVPVSMTAILIVLVFSAIQWFGLKSSSAIQSSLSLLKAAGLLVLVTAFFIHGKVSGDSTVIESTAQASPVVLFGAIILSFRAITLSFAGWNAPVYFSEENTDTRRDLPRSLIYGVLSITLIYVLVNVAMFCLMPVASIANSQLAVADGANIVFGAGGKMVVTIISIIIVMSSLYAGILYAPRIIFGISRSGLFFSFASKINRFHIPGIALVFTTILTVLFAASGTFEFVMSVYTFLYVFIDISVYAAALYARWKDKNLPSFKAKGFPITHLFMILVNAVLLISVFLEDTVSSRYALLVILLTVPLFFLFRMVNKSATHS